MALPLMLYDTIMGFRGFPWHLMRIRVLSWASMALSGHFHEICDSINVNETD